MRLHIRFLFVVYVAFAFVKSLLSNSGKDAQALNKQYSNKITALESEAAQARQELLEAQRQLHDLERQEREISGTDKSRAQECRRKIAAAQSKVQVRLGRVFNGKLNEIEILVPAVWKEILIRSVCATPANERFSFFAAGSQPASERHCSLGKPTCPEPAPRAGAGAKRSEYAAAAGAAAEAAAPGESAETASGDRDAAEDSQSQGHCDTRQRKLRVDYCTAS